MKPTTARIHVTLRQTVDSSYDIEIGSGLFDRLAADLRILFSKFSIICLYMKINCIFHQNTNKQFVDSILQVSSTL